MNRRQLIITAVGPDRPGLVNELTSIIYEEGANIEESRMALLAGDFAIILLCTGQPDAINRVQNQVQSLGTKLDLQLHFKHASKQREETHFTTFLLELTGLDRHGIVHQISKSLAGLEVNVVSLDTRLHEAPFHGTLMFSMHAEIQIPAEKALKTLEKQIEEICQEMYLSYDLSPISKEESEALSRPLS